MRRAARRDGNEPEIVRALEDIGVRVRRVSAGGVPDLLCWTRAEGYRVLEVKTETGRLTPAQRVFREQGFPVLVVRSVEDALRAYGVRG
jgi:hypothetical protein